MKKSLNAFMQKANSVSVEDLKNSIKGGLAENCHGELTNDKNGLPQGEPLPIMRQSDSRLFEVSFKGESFDYVKSFDASVATAVTFA